MKTSTNKLHLWEAALLLAFGLTLTAGVWASASEGALAGQVLRLHVVANSDDHADQALKLLVRDQVLARATELLTEAGDRTDGRCRVSATRAGSDKLRFFQTRCTHRQAAEWLTGYAAGSFRPGGSGWEDCTDKIQKKQGR